MHFNWLGRFAQILFDDAKVQVSTCLNKYNFNYLFKFIFLKIYLKN